MCKTWLSPGFFDLNVDSIFFFSLHFQLFLLQLQIIIMAATTSTTLPESSTYTQSNELTPRMTDLMSLSDYFESSSLASKAKTNVPLSLFLYIFRSLQSILSTLIFAPLTIFSDPIGVIAAIIIYPIIYFGLWLLTVVLWLTSLIGGGKLIEYLSKNYGDGYSPVNWVSFLSSFFL